MGNISSHPAAAMPAVPAAATTAVPNLTGNSSSCSKAAGGVSHTAVGRDVTGAAAATGHVDTSTAAGRHKKRVMLSEAKLQRHMDLEDRRVKELTEGVLYDFLPAALDVMVPNCEDPLQELDAKKCRAVAAAALAVSALMNAPPGFLEFLLCIPWRQLPQLYPTASQSAEQQDQADQLLAQLAVDEQERKLLVNMPIHPQLMQTVLGFLYRPEYADSLPPLLRPEHLPQDRTQQHVNGSGSQQSGPVAAGKGAVRACHVVVLDTVAALLDGATPLHCAAIRGNPAGVHHLLQCGGDPMRETAAGELPIELVPVCGCYNKETKQRQCHCLSAAEQEVWECRSRLARVLLAKRSLAIFHVGLFGHYRLALLCLLAFVGLLYGGRTLQRRALEAHVWRRREQIAQAADVRAHTLLSLMREEACRGSSFLSTAKQKAGYRQPVAEQTAAGAGGLASAAVPAVSAGAACGVICDESSVTLSSSGAQIGSLSERSGIAIGQTPFAPATQSAAAEVAGLQDYSAVQDLHVNDEQEQGQWVQPAAGVDSEQGLQKQQSITQQHGLVTVGSSSSKHSTACSAAASEQEFQTVDSMVGSQQQDGATALGPGAAAELAFKCYVKAVHALQSLGQGTMVNVSPDGSAQYRDSSTTSVAGLAGAPEQDPVSEVSVPTTADRAHLQGREQHQMPVLEDEQAELYSCWAESVLLKFQACGCPGCTALAVQAIRMAHLAVGKLYVRMQQLQQQLPQRWQAVERYYSRVVYAHIALMCQTEARLSPNKASVWRAQQCLQEWDELVEAKVLQPPEGQECSQAATQDNTCLGDVLRHWARTADSDLVIAEALLGSSLGAFTTLSEALSAALVSSDLAQPAEEPADKHSGSSTSCLPVLARPISSAVLDQLQAARGLAVCPSPPMKLLAAQVADAAARELSAGTRLRSLLNTRPVPTSTDYVAALADATAAARPFSSLAAEVAVGQALHDQCCQKAAVASRLQGVVAQAAQLTCHVTCSSSSTGSEQPGCIVNGVELPVLGFDVDSWCRCVAMLESAVEEAKDVNVSIVKARKLVKELNAQLAAAEAAALLQSCLAKRPCGSAALRAAISKAEAAAAGLSGTAASSSSTSVSGSGSTAGISCASSGCAVFSELLLQQLQVAKKRLDVERAAEALHKAVLVHRSLADLPKLEASILNARKVGAEELCPGDYKEASELRARMTAAARVKQQLDAAVKALATATAAGPVSRGGKQEEELVAPLEAVISEAQRWSDLLPEEAARAAEALEAWRNSSVCEAKLSRALLHGSSIAQLSRLIMDAAAAGVKVASARKVLKLQQLLEQAMAAAEDAGSVSTTRGQLAAKLEAAEQGGVALALLEPARKLLQKLAAAEALCALEAALKPHSDWSTTARMAALRTALDKAEDVLGTSVVKVMEQQQLKQRAGSHQQQQLLQCNSEQAGELVAAASAGNGTASASPAMSLQRTDSVASSSAGSELSTSSAATTGTQASSKVVHRSPSSSVGGEEVITAVQELAVRAWELLQQDQRLMGEIDRERAERERTCRELKERARQERQRAEAERLERSKAEREKQAAERKQARAKALADRGRNLVALWGSRRGAAWRSASGTGPDDDSGGSSRGSSSPVMRAPSAAKSPRPATAPGLRSPVTSPAPDSAPDARNASSRARTGHLPAGWRSEQQQQEQQNAAAAVQPVHHADGQARHLRGDSFDLGDASSKLGRDALALLDMPDHKPEACQSHSPQEGQEGQPQLPMRSPLSLDDVPSLQCNEDGAARGLGWQRASASWQGSLSTADAAEPQLSAAEPQPGAAEPQPGAAEPRLSAAQQIQNIAANGSSHPATPKFGLVDLGGASWGIDRSGGSFSRLSQLSPTGTAAAPALDSVWGSGPGTGPLADGSALPPLAPRSGNLARSSHPGRLQLGVTGVSGQGVSPWLSPRHDGDSVAAYEAAVDMPLQQQQQQHQQSLGCESSLGSAMAASSCQQSGGMLFLHRSANIASGGPLSYADFRSAAGDLSLLRQQQQQQVGTPALVGGVVAPAFPGGSLGPLGLSARLAQQQQQILQLQLLQQQQQKLLQLRLLQQQQQQLLLGSGPFTAGVGGGQAFLPGTSATAPALSSAGLPNRTVSHHSNSSAFGVPHLVAFGGSSGDLGAECSRGQVPSTDIVAECEYTGVEAPVAGVVAIPGDDRRPARHSEPDPVKQLPDDLSFSPPVAGPAGKLLGPGW